MLVYAPLALPILIPIHIPTPRLANFILVSGERRNRKTSVSAELVVVMLELIWEYGCTIGFGIKEHMRGKQVALCQDCIADYWGFLPGNMKLT